MKDNLWPNNYIFIRSQAFGYKSVAFSRLYTINSSDWQSGEIDLSN